MSYQFDTLESSALSTLTSVPVAIRGMGIISPAGVGVEAFARTLNQSSKTTSMTSSKSEFDAPKELGRKGLSSLDRMSRMAIIGSREALSFLTPEPGRTGVVLGNSGGSFDSISAFVASTYTADQPHLVSPLKFPNTVMNCAASQCAIRLGLTGINSTVCAGDMSGFHALAYSIRSLRLGHSDGLIAGSIEECCDYTETAHKAMHGSKPMADGCAFFALEKVDSVVDFVTGPKILATRSRRITSGKTPSQSFLSCISRLCLETGTSIGDIKWISFPDHHTLHLPTGIDNYKTLSNRATSIYGNFRTASISFRLADVLIQKPRGRGLLIAASEKEVGCVLLDGLS